MCLNWRSTDGPQLRPGSLVIQTGQIQPHLDLPTVVEQVQEWTKHMLLVLLPCLPAEPAQLRAKGV
jgi:hypothetical protein